MFLRLQLETRPLIPRGHLRNAKVWVQGKDRDSTSQLLCATFHTDGGRPNN